MKSLKNLILFMILSFLLFQACSRTTPAVTAPPSVQVPAPAVSTEGKALFDKNCAACHGASGEGTSLAPRIAGHSVGAMKMQVRNPMGTMPAFTPSKLSDSDVDKIAAFMSGMTSSAMAPSEWEKAAPETIHHWMALLAMKNNDMANARQHLEDALTFVKEPKHKTEMEKAMTMMAQGKTHDAEHEIEEMAGSEAPSGITMQKFHLQLVKIAIEAKNIAEVKRHTEHFMAKATDKQKKIAQELLEKAEKGDFHEAEHELEELIKD